MLENLQQRDYGVKEMLEKIFESGEYKNFEESEVSKGEIVRERNNFI